MTSKPLADTLARGVAFHKERQLEQALAWYRAALAIDPDDAEANSLTGLALVHSGRADEGRSYLRRAIELEPGQAAFRFNLVQALRAAGAYDNALAELGVILAHEPDNARAWERAGDIALQQQDPAGAALAWAKACQADPTVLAPALKLAGLEIERARFDAALAVLNPLADRAAQDEAIYVLWCQALVGLRDWRALRETARSWTAGYPASVDAWRNLSRAAFERGRHREAVEAFRHVLGLQSPAAADLTAYAVLCQHALDFDAAEASLSQAESLDPGNAETLANLALARTYRGRFDEALDYCRRALAVEPEHVPAYSVLSALRAGRLTDEELAVVARLADDPGVAADRRIAAAFSRARALDARGDVDGAFAALEAAHELAGTRDAAEGRAYNPLQEDARARRLVETASGPTAPTEATGPRPIFILGMPRSGSTLVEAVLGAHPRVFACGERPAMRQIQRAFEMLQMVGNAPDERMLGNWARSYLQSLPGLGGADHVTDKHPLNIEAVGLILRLFPDAVVLHLRRDPVEACFSVYRNEFNRSWTFAHRLADIAHHYLRGEMLAAHWAETFPTRFHTLQYEAFVDDFANAAPALVTRCGLAWEPRCLEFQRSPRAIATASAVAVRGPVANGNVRAAEYARHLGVLIEALQAGKRGHS